MADQPAPRRKGFDITHPGFKEYAIVLALTLGGYLAYEWWKNRSSGTAAATGTTASSPVLQGPGPGAAALWLAIQDLQGKTTTTTTSNGTDDQGVSRENRSPKVRRQIHQIHKEHVASEKRK